MARPSVTYIIKFYGKILSTLTGVARRLPRHLVKMKEIERNDINCQKGKWRRNHYEVHVQMTALWNHAKVEIMLV